MVSVTPTGVLRLVDRFDLLALQSPVESWIKLLGTLWAWFVGADLAVFLAIWFVAKVMAFIYLFAVADSGHSAGRHSPALVDTRPSRQLAPVWRWFRRPQAG